VTKLSIFKLQRAVSCANERERRVPGLFLTEGTQYGGRYRGGVLLFDSPHHHAQMSCFNDYSYALRLDSTLNRFSNLCCEALLHLQTTCEYVYQAGTLLSPITFPSGIQATWILPKNGKR
jgi:hypothetical protein